MYNSNQYNTEQYNQTQGTVLLPVYSQSVYPKGTVDITVLRPYAETNDVQSTSQFPT